MCGRCGLHLTGHSQNLGCWYEKWYQCADGGSWHPIYGDPDKWWIEDEEYTEVAMVVAVGLVLGNWDIRDFKGGVTMVRFGDKEER